MFNNIEFHNKVAELSINKFQSLSKMGKPNSQEWTVLSTIVVYNKGTEIFEVVALGTGSKCIGQNLMSGKGDVLNDSHAEMICRRAFLKFIYNSITSFLETSESNLLHKTENNKLGLNENISFHFFSTHVPCGDAAIFPKDNDDNDFGICLFENNTVDDIPTKRLKMDPDIFRTGAKCLEHEGKQDKKLSGTDYHTTAAIRTKPGRGDPTLSVSCSDKIAKWTYVGIQGSLLNNFFQEPMYLSTITIAAKVPFSDEAIIRAIDKRFDVIELPKPFIRTVPFMLQSDIEFEFAKTDKKQPCPSSIIWYKNCDKIEVAVEGRKQGITKKNREKKSGRLKICKKELFNCFVSIINNYSYFHNLGNYKLVTYIEAKEKNVKYSFYWRFVKEKVFKVWTVKDKSLLKFDYYD